VSDFDAFNWFWRAMVLAIVGINVAWGRNDLKRGSARLSWYGSRVDRNEEPFEFWLAVLGKFASVPVGIMMLYLSFSAFGVGG